MSSSVLLRQSWPHYSVPCILAFQSTQWTPLFTSRPRPSPAHFQGNNFFIVHTHVEYTAPTLSKTPASRVWELEKELLLEGKGVSRLEPSDEPDLDSASEPEGPLAITSRASSVTCPSSPADKVVQQEPKVGKEPLVCSVFPTAPWKKEPGAFSISQDTLTITIPRLDFHSDVLSVSQTQREGIE